MQDIVSNRSCFPFNPRSCPPEPSGVRYQREAVARAIRGPHVDASHNTETIRKPDIGAKGMQRTAIFEPAVHGVSGLASATISLHLGHLGIGGPFGRLPQLDGFLARLVFRASGTRRSEGSSAKLREK